MAKLCHEHSTEQLGAAAVGGGASPILNSSDNHNPVGHRRRITTGRQDNPNAANSATSGAATKHGANATL